MLLSTIKKELDKQEFESTLSSPDAMHPLERLVVSLGPDNKNRTRALEICVFQLVIPKEIANQHAQASPIRVQFKVGLPFKIDDLALNQVASLLLFINPFLELPGFELNELTNVVSYRYIWLLKEHLYDSELLGHIMGAIILTLNLFADMIELLADGKATFNDLLEQIIDIVNPSNGK